MDFDGDGTLDLISGSYDPGAIYLFRGKGNGGYAARETLTDKNGKPILLYPNQTEEWESFGTWPAMVDWDEDGDLDLVIGGYRGEVLLRLNEGTRTEPAFATDNIPVKVGDEELTVPGGHATPVIADWDDDGRWDLLSGSATGAVSWYRNIGKPGAPEFAPPETLIPAHEGDGYNEFLDAGAEPPPGIRSQIAVTDYNGDGKLDLLLGDFCTTIVPRSDLSAEEREAFERLRREIAATKAQIKPVEKQFRARLDDFIRELRRAGLSDEEFARRYAEKLEEVPESRVLDELHAKSKGLEQEIRKYLAEPEFKSYAADEKATPHGFVWLFLRK